MTEIRLRVDGLVKNFGGVRALDGVSFTTAAGIVQGIVGPNGSGKTTTVDCITGFQRPDLGSIELDGASIDRLPVYRRARLGIRRTFQALHVFEEMTVLDELLLASQSFDSGRLYDDWLRTARLRRVERDARRRAAEVLEIVRLEHVIDHLVHELSYGQRKLVALGGALMSSPRLLCLDEPLAGVSPRQVDEMAEVIGNLRQHHVTTLLVEHNVDFVTSVSDEVVVMSEGVVHTHGSPSVLHEDDEVFEVMFGGR